jgi:hypothetical protein
MPTQQPFLSRQRIALLVVLFTLLASAYMLVYSGYMESGDSRVLFNAVTSYYRYGDFSLDLLMSERLPETFDPSALALLVPANVEPLPLLLAQPLYALADRIPGLGLVHTVWVFNVIVSALVGCLTYVYALALGARERTAVVTALAFGLGTIIVPYSKTFFREPLTLLTILLAAYAAERARTSGYALGWLAAFGLALGAALLTRASAALALPALLLILLPAGAKLERKAGGADGEKLGKVARRRYAALAVLLALGISGVALLVLAGDSVAGGRYDILARLNADRGYLITALHSYLISIGGSVWATSPVALLALAGAWLRWRSRYVWVALLMLVSFAGGYALLSGVHWFGGLSWPPRFLMPVVPFLLLAGIPALERALQSPRRWAFAGLSLLFAYSLWVQFCAVSLRWSAYGAALPPEAAGLLEWGGGLNLVAYLRWLVIPGLWGAQPLDFAWVRANLPLWPLAFAVLIIASLSLLLRTLHLPSPNQYPKPRTQNPELRTPLFPHLLLTAWLLLTGLALRALYDTDSLYNAGNPALHAMLADLERETTASDVVILSNPAYVDFFFNYARLRDAARPIALPIHPGDRPSEEQPSLIEAANPDLLVRMQTIPLIYALAADRERIWLLENFGPALPWAVRPVERFMAAHFHPLRVLESAPQVRLIEFSTASQPDPFGGRAPAIPTDLRFGDHIYLLGFDLPAGTHYAPGAALPVALAWQTSAPLEADYTVGLFLRTAGDQPVTQSDVQPGWGFSPTGRWTPGALVWDARALHLPADLAPGTYQLWVKVYRFDADFQPVDLPVAGSGTRDNVIGVLPVQIDVAHSAP